MFGALDRLEEVRKSEALHEERRRKLLIGLKAAAGALIKAQYNATAAESWAELRFGSDKPETLEEGLEAIRGTSDGPASAALEGREPDDLESVLLNSILCCVLHGVGDDAVAGSEAMVFWELLVNWELGDTPPSEGVVDVIRKAGTLAHVQVGPPAALFLFSFTNRISALDPPQSASGKSQAWLRLALNADMLHSTVAELLDTQVAHTYYQNHALILCKNGGAGIFLLITTCLGKLKLKYDLDVDNPEFDRLCELSRPCASPEPVAEESAASDGLGQKAQALLGKHGGLRLAACLLAACGGSHALRTAPAR